MELKLSDIKEYILRKYGIELKEDKLKKLYSIIGKNIDVSRFTEKKILFDFMDNHRDLREEIIDEIVVHETHFFRNVHQFIQLRDYILPYLIRRNKKLKILSLGCSSGEEPYSVAMIVDYYFKGFKKDISIDAVDLSQKAIEKAKSGIYRKYSFKNYNEFKDLEAYYFTVNGKNFVLSDDIKRMVRFTKENVFEFFKYDKSNYSLIFCRNLIIYFDEKTMRKFLDLVLAHLDKDGFYVAGHSEILEKIHDGFQIMFLGETFIYKRRSIYKPVEVEPAVKKRNEDVLKKKGKQVPLRKNVQIKNVEPKIDFLNKKETIYRLLEEENFEKAEQSCEELLAIKEDEDVKVAFSYILMNLKKFEKASEILKKTKGFNSSVKYHILLGINYYFLMQFDKAIKSFKNVLFICDSSIYAYYYLGLIYEQKQNYNMAKKYFDKAISNRLSDNCNYDFDRIDKNLKIELEEFIKIAKEKVNKINMLIKE